VGGIVLQSHSFVCLPAPSFRFLIHTYHHPNIPGVGVLVFGLALVPVLQRVAGPILSLLSGGTGGGLVEKGVFARAVEYYCIRVRT
jgi:hypothetical protein